MSKLVYGLLCLYLAMMPFENLAVIPEIASFLRILGLVTVGCSVLDIVATRTMKRLPAAIVPMVLFAGWATLSLAWSIDLVATQGRSVTYWLLLTFVWLVWQYAETLRRQQWLLRIFLGSVAVALVSQYCNRFSGGEVGMGEERYGVQGFDLNAMAYFLLTSMNVASYFLSQSSLVTRKTTKAMLWVYLVAAALGVLFTGSRSAAVGLVLCITLLLLTMPRMGWKPAAVFFVCAIVGGILIPWLVPSASFERYAEGRSAATYESRVMFWKNGLSTWSRTPILGVGAGGFRAAEAAAGGRGSVAHNTFVSVLVENGIVGFGLYGTFAILLVWRVLRMPSDERILWIKILVCYFPMLMAGSEEYSKLTWLFFALILRQSSTLRYRLARQWQGSRTVAPRLPLYGYRPSPGSM